MVRSTGTEGVIMATKEIAPRVWIGCIACYNGGRLIGEWFDATEAGDVTPETIHGRATSHEELWVYDLEGFGAALTGETSPAQAQRIADDLASADDNERGAYAAWMGNGNDPVLSRFREQFRGEWDTFKAYAEEQAEETMMLKIDVGGYGERKMIDNPLAPYVDWDMYASELENDYTVVDIDGGGVWIFEDNA
jgi:antirestriction protein